MKELREIEFKFHDTGDPFSEIPSPSREALLIHEKRIAEVMGPEIGQVFLAHLSGTNE